MGDFFYFTSFFLVPRRVCVWQPTVLFFFSLSRGVLCLLALRGERGIYVSGRLMIHEKGICGGRWKQLHIDGEDELRDMWRV